MLDMLDFDIEISVPYWYLIKFNKEFKHHSENYFLHHNGSKGFVSSPESVNDTTKNNGSEQDFERLWAMLMNLITNIMQDTFYFPFCLNHHPALIFIACLSIAQSSIAYIYEGVELIPEPRSSDKTDTESNDGIPSALDCIWDDAEITVENISQCKHDIDSMYQKFDALLKEFKKD